MIRGELGGAIQPDDDGCARSTPTNRTDIGFAARIAQ